MKKATKDIVHLPLSLVRKNSADVFIIDGVAGLNVCLIHRFTSLNPESTRE